VPLATLGLVQAAFAATRELLVQWRVGVASNLMLVALAALISFEAVPGVYNARFNIALVAAVIVVGSWALRGPANRRLREGVLGAAIAFSIVPLYWTKGWYFGTTLQHIAPLMRAPAHERAYMNSEAFDLPESIARFREQELGPGARVAFDEDVWMPGALWNFKFSNELKFVPFEDGRQFAARLDAYRPAWVVVGDSGDARKTLDGAPQQWEYVGKGTSAYPATVVYRRR
jgi:hypothetical protein